MTTRVGRNGSCKVVGKQAGRQVHECHRKIDRQIAYRSPPPPQWGLIIRKDKSAGVADEIILLLEKLKTMQAHMFTGESMCQMIQARFSKGYARPFLLCSAASKRIRVSRHTTRVPARRAPCKCTKSRNKAT